jgi:hypothetical protein
MQLINDNTLSKEIKSDYYVLLTGQRGNSGDDLIKESAVNLLKTLRQDRSLIIFPSWEYFNDERLDIVNNSKALILCGGPALRQNTFGDVYKLRKNLNDIKVPILTFGIGYRDTLGSWNNTYQFEISDQTIALLKKINENGFLSSVRCYNTLNVLKSHGLNNFVMTGCPAFYKFPQFSEPAVSFDEIKTIGFSTGRKYQTLPGMAEQQIQLIKSLVSHFPNCKLTVAFHDPIDPSSEKTNQILQFLNEQNIDYKDISHSAQNLINFYSKIDIHVGFRVHGHIFMSSIKKPSILLCEDGRGKGIRNTINGLIFDAYDYQKLNFTQRLINKLLKKQLYFESTPKKDIASDVINQLEIEKSQGWQRSKSTFDAINNHFSNLRAFIAQMP